MNFLGKLLSSASAQPIEAVGNVLDKLFTSDEEKLDKKILLERLLQQPTLAQTEINKIEAQHRSVFVAGWRPFIGWICGISLSIFYIPQFSIASYLWINVFISTGEIIPYPGSIDGLMELLLAMLGMGALRTFEKMGGRAK